VETNLKQGQEELKKQFESEHAISLDQEQFYLRLSLPLLLEKTIMEQNDTQFNKKFEINDFPSKEGEVKEMMKNVLFVKEGKFYINVFSHSKVPSGDKPHPSFSLTKLGFETKLNQLKIYTDLCFNDELIKKISSREKFCLYLKKLGQFFLENQFNSLLTKDGLFYQYKIQDNGLKIRDSRKSFKLNENCFPKEKIILGKRFWNEKSKSNKEVPQQKVLFKEEHKQKSQDVKMPLKPTKKSINKPLIQEIKPKEYNFDLTKSIKKGKNLLKFSFKENEFTISKLDIQVKKR
jgi:hypothetical protein